MKYAVIATYINGTSTGAVINAVSDRDAWISALSLFDHGKYIQSIQVSAILTEECGGEFEEEP
ncbi:hypothetical protein NE539_02190 [Flavonifractor plautii]|jgi:hypothetical protein|uniref:hypothetical protein n=1 Tax=Flavonifractor plautii TaxID=292800 RepID=UPI002052DF48|nr:hypothetical protein [Flavonifractor plautii]MCQ4992110.1 hypothetical protein [Flavonifractor plautii]DAY55436.1 MAG TPA: hypothetical protein [Caudoviricetes sp.]